jgi:hypothetical protein
MGAAAIVLVLVASDELRDPATAALTRTAEEALEGRAVVVVREAERREISDTDATSLGTAIHADAVAVITWSLPDRRRAYVHLYDAHDSKWVDRSIAFAAEDPAVERGRLLGFEVAAMAPRHVEQPVPPPPPPPIERPPEPTPPPRLPRAMLEGVGIAAGGVDGPGGGVGAEIAGRLAFGDLGARVGAGIRTLAIDDPHADGATIRLGVGLTLRVFERRSVSIGARADLLALRMALSRDNGSSDRVWSFGVDGLGEVAWAFAPPVSGVLALGAEVAPGRTRVYIDGNEATTLAVVRIVGEAGLRVSF